MIVNPNIMPFVEQAKFFLSVGGGFWAAFTAYTYVKTALDNTQRGVEGIKTELASQTQAIVKATSEQTGALKDMHGDVKMMIQAMLQPPTKARAARAARHKK